MGRRGDLTVCEFVDVYREYLMLVRFLLIFIANHDLMLTKACGSFGARDTVSEHAGVRRHRVSVRAQNGFLFFSE